MAGTADPSVPATPEPWFRGVVSVPEHLLLLSGALDGAPDGAPESALVVPALSLDSVSYFRCLVDTQEIVEHAVVFNQEIHDRPRDCELVRQLLQLRRPHAVSFCRLTLDGELQLLSDVRDWRGAVCAAAAVHARILRGPAEAPAFGGSATHPATRLTTRLTTRLVDPSPPERPSATSPAGPPSVDPGSVTRVRLGSLQPEARPIAARMFEVDCHFRDRVYACEARQTANV